MRKTILQDFQSCSVQKSARKNTKYSRNETILKNRPSSSKGYSLCKMVSLGQELKLPKTCEKSINKIIRVVLCKKTARKHTKYSRNETILTIAHLAKAIQPMQRLQPLQNGHFKSKIKIATNMRTTILQDYQSCSAQKTARKNTKYSRNETILKISHLAKAIAHAKAIVFAKWPV